jgi:hypothetical protein
LSHQHSNWFKKVSLPIAIALLWMKVSLASNIGGFTGASIRLASDPLAAGSGGITLFDQSSTNSYAHNPAALAFSSNRRFDISTVNLSLDRFIHTVNASLPLPPTARLSFGLIAEGTKDIMARDSRGFQAGLMDDSEIIYLASFSNRFSKKLAIGVSLKLLTRSLVSEEDFLDLDASGFGAGLGLLYQVNEGSVFGITLKDWNASYKWNTKDFLDQSDSYRDEFPMSLAWGWKQNFDRFQLMVEHDHYFAGTNVYRFGVLWDSIQGISMRGGASYEDGAIFPGLGIRFEKSLLEGLPMHIDLGVVDGIAWEGWRTYMGWGMTF